MSYCFRKLKTILNKNNIEFEIRCKTDMEIGFNNSDIKMVIQTDQSVTTYAFCITTLLHNDRPLYCSDLGYKYKENVRFYEPEEFELHLNEMIIRLSGHNKDEFNIDVREEESEEESEEEEPTTPEYHDDLPNIQTMMETLMKTMSMMTRNRE